MAGDFSFPDFTNAYPSTPLNGFPDGAQNFQPMQPNPSAVYPQVPHQQPQYGQPAPQSGEKSKASGAPGNGALNFEEASRHAAEEDKRRRNTAASARFRIKKKQREQALEKNAKEMSEKVSNLETKVQQLEMENKWLKNLLVEKNEGNEEIVSLWKEFAASKQPSEKPKGESKTATSVKDETR
ncbi:Fc.00g015420.m01.CDS01 [Cosmosporella sp. VM-42]